MNIATSIDNDGETIDISLFSKYVNYGGENKSLWIHPNVEGHQKMADRVKLDCPELF